MPRSSRGFARGRRAPTRTSVWQLGPGGDDIVTMDVTQFTTTNTVILGSGVTPVPDPVTIVRTRGFLELNLTGAAAARDGYSWAAGIGIVQEDAFAVGVTAIPKPFEDVDWGGWLWHTMGALHAPSAGVADVGPNPQIVQIDSKAMRKLGFDEVAFLAVEAGETGEAIMDVRGGTRMLIKLT